MIVLLEFNDQCKYEMTWNSDSATLEDTNADIEEAVDCTGVSHWVVIVNTENDKTITIYCETKLKFTFSSFGHLVCDVSIDHHLLTGFHFDGKHKKVRYAVAETSSKSSKYFKAILAS